MPTVSTPEGLIAFPDSMSPEEIRAALVARFRPQQAAPAPAADAVVPEPAPAAPLTREQQIDAAMRRRRLEMFGVERTRDELFNDPNTPADQKLAIAREMAADDPRDWVQYTLGRLPFSFTDAYTTMSTYGGLGMDSAMDRYRRGEATREDLLAIAQAERQAQLDSQRGVLGRAADVVTRFPGMATEFAMTGGAAGAAKAAAGNSALGQAAAAMTRAALIPNHAVGNYANRRAKGESEASAVVKGFVESVIDMGVEQLGVALPKPKVAKALGEWLTKRTGKPLLDLTVAGYHGPLAEVVEERVAELAKTPLMNLRDFEGAGAAALQGQFLDAGKQALTAVRDNIDGATGDLLRGQFAEAGKQILSEFLGFMVPGAANQAVTGMAAIDQRMVERQQARNEALADERYLDELAQRQEEEGPKLVRRGGPSPPGQGPLSDRVRGVVTSSPSMTPEQFFRQHPDRLEAVAALPDSPSRSQFAQASGLPRASNNQARRSGFVQAAREMLSQPARRESTFDEVAETMPTVDPAATAPGYYEPAQETPTKENAPDLVGISQRVSRPAMQRLLASPGALDLFRQQLEGMTASQLQKAYGYAQPKVKKGKKKKGARKQSMIDDIVDRFSTPERAESTQAEPPREVYGPFQQYQPIRQEQPPQGPVPTPRSPARSPAAPPVQQQEPVPLPLQQAAQQQQQVAPEPAPPAAPTAPEMLPQVQAIYDQLPADKDQLETLAATLGHPLPKKGTKARKAIKPDELRRELAEAMGNPKARKGLVGEVAPPQASAPRRDVPETPAEQYGPDQQYGPFEQVGPQQQFNPLAQYGPDQQYGPEPPKSKGRKQPAAEAQPTKTKPKSKGKKTDTTQTLGNRDTSDRAVREGLANFKKAGFQVKVEKGSQPIHREIEEFAASLGVRVVFFSRQDGKTAKLGMAMGGVAFIDINHPEAGIWEIAGHEIAHAAAIDELKADFDPEMIEPFAQQHYDKAKKFIRDRLDADPDLRYREGVATLVGKFLGDSSLRKSLREGEPQKQGLWKKLVDKLSVLWDKAPEAPKAPPKKKGRKETAESAVDKSPWETVRRVLKREMNRPEYREAGARLRVRDIVQGEIELGTIPESQRDQVEKELLEEVKRVWKEKADAIEDRERAKAYLKQRLGLNAGNISMLENQGRDAASINGLDTAASDAASMFPGVFSGQGHQDSDIAYAEQGFELLREAQQQPPTLDSDEVFDEALGQIFAGAQQPAADPYADLLAQVKRGENKEIFDEIVAVIQEEVKDGGQVQDVEREALERLQALLDQGDEDIPFMAEREPGEADDTSKAAPEDFIDPRLRKIAEIPGALDLARKLFKDPSKRPTPEQIRTQRAFDRANPGKTLGARQAVFTRDVLENEPVHRPRSFAEQQAQRLLAKHGPQKYLKEFADRFKNGHFYFKTETEVVIARDLINQTAISSILTQSEQAVNDFAALLNGYRTARSETARQLSLPDPIMTNRRARNNRALTEMIVRLDPKIRKKILDSLKKNDIDIKDPELLKDDNKVIRAMAIARSHIPGTYADMVYEYYLNSILSGPQTHIANLIGNVTNAFWYNFPERIGEIVMSKMTAPLTGGEAQEFRELLEVYKGMYAAIGLASANAVKAWKYEYSPLNLQVGRGFQDMMKFVDQPRGGAIPGRGGKIARMSFRALATVDEFARTITAHGAVAAQAYRQAKREGTPRDQIGARIAAIVANKGSQSWQEAMKEADYQAFQQESGIIGQAVKDSFNAFKQKIPGVRYVIPFSSFLVNSFSRAADLMPFAGLIAAGANEVAIYRGKNGKKPDWNRLLANQAIAMGALMIVNMVMEFGDDEDGFPLITGTRERNLAARSGQYRTAPPLSIRIGGKYYSYSRVEPFNVWLSTMVDLYEAYQNPDTSSLKALESSAIAQVQDKNYMQGFSDIASIFEREGNALDLAVNTAVGFVPNLLRQPIRESRNAVLETRLRGTDTWTEMKNKILTKAELPVTGHLYRYDVWGRKLQPNTPRTSLPYRVLSPFKVKDKRDVLSVDAAIMQYNEANPKKAWTPNTPNPPKVDGLTNKEYETYTRERGLIARNIVENIKFSSPPTDAQIAAVKSALETQGTTIAKARLLARRAGKEPKPLRGWDD